jgi:BlaI family penicillinase repressor
MRGVEQMPALPPLTESEWLIMKRLWDRFPQTAAEIVETKLDGEKLPDATVRSLLRRLVAKKAAAYTVDEHNANLYHYYPLICEQDCIRKENQHFFKLYYSNNTSKLISAFVDDFELSDEEIDNFKKLLDAKKKGDS